MAAGITGGAAATSTIFLEDDTHADADLDGVLDEYHPDDIIAKGLAGAGTTDLGTFTKHYRCRGSIQNGDGVGSATTTWALKDCCISFDSGRTYIMSTLGQANRWTKYGELIQGPTGKPSGRRGVRIDFGGQTLHRGNFQIYGSHLRNAGNGALQFVPGSTGRTTEMVNVILETTGGAGNMVFGSGAGSLQRLYNVDLILGGTGVVSNMQVDSVERLTVAVTGSNNYFISTGAAFAIKDGVFIGTPLVADLRYTSGFFGHLINHTWSGNAPKFDVASMIHEWQTFRIRTIYPDVGTPVANVPIRLLDSFGNEIFFVYTDALGRISFNNDPDGLGREIFDNAVFVIRLTSDPLQLLDPNPFTLRINLDGTPVPGFPAQQFKFEWPYTDLPNGYGRQYTPIGDLTPLQIPVPPGWVECQMDIPHA